MQTKQNVRSLFFICLSLIFLASCGSGDSDSGAEIDDSQPGSMISGFVGVYTGTLTVVAEGAGITEMDTFPITVTVSEDGTLRFDGDEPDETFTVGLTDQGTFSGSLDINEDPCEGTVNTQGGINGNVVSGDVSGSGVCNIGLDIDVTLTGTFSATR